jgi:hypothetical protein
VADEARAFGESSVRLDLSDVEHSDMAEHSLAEPPAPAQCDDHGYVIRLKRIYNF